MRRAVTLALVLSLSVLASAAEAHGPARTVHFEGKTVRVPVGWPVFRLAERPRMCVRLDRRAVYLGTPGAGQRCPASAIGRQRAIVVDPASRERAAASGSAATMSLAGGAAFTGLGFDACTAPSSRSMAAWGVSPYRAIGVYIGGINRGCSQPNLTTTWVEEQVAAGWHLIPTYVGLQAPTSACTSCAELSLSTSAAAIQGAAAADDAVADAESVGIGPGSPIYYDMEAYTLTSSASKATLAFLGAWTTQLHALGYTSGVYSSSASGIADLVDEIGTLYPLPDEIWMANWNGQESVLDPYVPATAWVGHRIHQYRGGHDETWGRVTINIDNNYVEGATAGVAAAPPTLPPLTVKNVKPERGTVRLWVRCGWAEGESCPGRIILRTHARVPLRARPGVPTKVVRLAVSQRTFRLAGGKSHTFRVALNERGRPLFYSRGSLRAQLLVAIPGSRATRAVELKLVR